MKKNEAIDILFAAKWVLKDMGLGQEAWEAEQAEMSLYLGFSSKEAHTYADFILPRGKRGHVRLVLNPPPVARAIAFIAAILRSVED